MLNSVQHLECPVRSRASEMQDALKTQKHCFPDELMVGDCWIGLTQASGSGLILAARVGKHTDEFIDQLIVNTEGKTDCQQWHTDGWGGYERVFRPEVRHVIGKDQTQQLERTNGIVRQQTGRWHRRQQKFALILGADGSDDSISGQLFQLDLDS